MKFRAQGHGLLIFSLLCYGLSSEALASKMQCSGELVRQVKGGTQKGSYSASLNFRFPTGGGDRRAGGEGRIRLTRNATRQSSNLTLKCQAEVGLPGALVCTSPNIDNPFKSPLILEIYPEREGKPQQIQLFIGAWDSLPSARAALGQNCR